MDEIQKHMIYDWLQTHPCATLATHSAEGLINLAQIFVYVNENFEMRFLTRRDNRKFANLSRISEVALMFFNQASLTQVEYTGVTRILTENTQIADTLAKLQNVFSTQQPNYWVPPLAQIDAGKYMAVHIDPRQIIYRSYVRPGGDISEPEEISISFQ